jgi:integrase
VHFHALRHAFARAMDAAGAPVTATQQRLGHRSLDTTTRYLAALRREDNPYGDQVAALLLPS